MRVWKQTTIGSKINKDAPQAAKILLVTACWAQAGRQARGALHGASIEDRGAKAAHAGYGDSSLAPSALRIASRRAAAMTNLCKVRVRERARAGDGSAETLAEHADGNLLREVERVRDARDSFTVPDSALDVIASAPVAESGASAQRKCGEAWRKVALWGPRAVVCRGLVNSPPRNALNLAVIDGTSLIIGWKPSSVEGAAALTAPGTITRVKLERVFLSSRPHVAYMRYKVWLGRQGTFMRRHMGAFSAAGSGGNWWWWTAALLGEHTPLSIMYHQVSISTRATARHGGGPGLRSARRMDAPWDSSHTATPRHYGPAAQHRRCEVDDSISVCHARWHTAAPPQSDDAARHLSPNTQTAQCVGNGAAWAYEAKHNGLRPHTRMAQRASVHSGTARCDTSAGRIRDDASTDGAAGRQQKSGRAIDGSAVCPAHLWATLVLWTAHRNPRGAELQGGHDVPSCAPPRSQAAEPRRTISSPQPRDDGVRDGTAGTGWSDCDLAVGPADADARSHITAEFESHELS
ncbi:hypothetical protein HYPSUDRAFT_1101438 [Hypholoma sublateritium FD-334 SS-4]|uniref:Uncharacterized protein n=1 Tax=Hypholoma sublateritium (strain FD-334 SS-4) TaxID=945553 RepID=A0A0D2LHH2_HYPSF|nr:hypothetical protein HYPSUDRAFT_1101438 [Hypholoma sublateritium FD-334 SS-4]